MDLDETRPLCLTHSCERKMMTASIGKINPSDELSSPQQLLMRFDTIISRLLSSVQSFELVERYEIHRKFHVGCGGDSSVQRDLLSLFSLLYDSLQSTSHSGKASQ